MFVYDKISGVAGYIISGEDGDYFDPHEHRRLTKPTSYLETMVHLLKGSVGAGVLAMHQAMWRTGLLVGIPGVFVIGLFATYCIHHLINAQYEVCRRCRRGYISYAGSCRRAVSWGPACTKWMSPAMPCIINFSLMFFQFGLCTVYVVFVAENCKQVLDIHGHEMALRVIILILLLPLVVVCLIKELKVLAYVSSFANIVTLFAFILVFYYLMADDLVITDEHFATKSIENLPIYVGITLFALEAVGVVMAVEYNMENPKDFGGFFGAFNIAMFFITLLYALVGTIGYLKYGNDVLPSITLNLPSQEKKAQASKVLMAIAIFCSFPLQNFVAYQLIWVKVKRRIKHKPAHTIHVSDYCLRVFLVLVPWVVAFAVPKLEGLISLIGGFCISLLAFIIPAFMDLCLVWSEREFPKPRRPDRPFRKPQVVKPEVLLDDPTLQSSRLTSSVSRLRVGSKTDTRTGFLFDKTAKPKASTIELPGNMTEAAFVSRRNAARAAQPFGMYRILRVVWDILLMIAGTIAMCSGIFTSVRSML